MKYAILFLFLAACLSASAQEQPDSTATAYENRNGVFYSVVRNFFPSGRIVTEENPLGSDTLAVANAIVGPVFVSSAQMAERAVSVARIARNRQQINAASSALQALMGIDYFDVMDNIVSRELLPDTIASVPYTMRVNSGSAINVELRRNNNGRLVMRQGSTNFRVDIISQNWIRLRRYQGTDQETADNSVRVDLFQERPGRWISLDLRYGLRQQ